MTNKIFPTVNQLVNVHRGSGYVVGKMADNHDVINYLRKGTLVFNADSVQSIFKAIKELKWEPEREKSSNTNRGSNTDFYTFENLEEAIHTYTKNPQSVREFKEEALRLTAEENVGKEIKYDVVGDYIDIGRFLDGEPECFGVAHQGNPSGLYTTLIMNLSAVSHVSAAAMNHKQARILRLVDWMESQGIRCQIRGFLSSQCSHVDIRVKDFEDAVDMNTLAVVSHGDFLRRVNFLIDEQSDTWEYGYGSPRKFTHMMTDKYKAEDSDGLTVFIGDQSHSYTEDIDTAFDTLRDKITELIESPQNRDFSKVYSVQL